MPGTRIRSTGASPTPRAAAATWGLVVAALLAATPAAAQDLVILRDGARQTGALASCVGEVCVLDGRQLPKGEIAWVGFGREGAPPASATGGELDEIHLASGEAVPGTVAGVSLGTVALESGSYDRREVAWIRFAGAEAPRRDVLVLRGGGALEGELRSCVGEACTLESQSVPLAGIAWIGLAVAEVAPPGGGVPAEGVLHLADGTETAGRLVGISAGQVVSDRGSYPRQQVAWVGVPLPEPVRGPQPGQIGAPLPDAPAPGASSPTPQPGPPRGPPPSGGSLGPPASTSAQPRPKNPTPVRPCPPEDPLGGRVQVSWAYVPAHGGPTPLCEAPIRMSLWFPLLSGRPWDRELEVPWPYSLLRYHAPEVDYEIFWDECVDLPSHVDEVCTAPAGQASGTLRVSENEFRLSFAPLDPSLELMFGTWRTQQEMLQDQYLELTCVSPGSFGTSEYGIGGLELIIGPGGEQGCRGGSVDGIQAFCVAPTLCYGDDSPCVPPDHFAVIPFSGQESWTQPGPVGWDQGIVRSAARWEICCGCGEPPSGPPPDFDPRPPEDDPCEELARRLAALRGRLAALADVWRAEQQAFNEATARRDAARDAIWGADGALAAYFDSVLELTALGAKGAWSKIAAMARKGRELLAAGNADQLQQELTEFVISQELGDVPKKIFDQEAVRLAGEAAEAYLQATGDESGAQQRYLQALKVHSKRFGDVQDAVKAFKLGLALPGHYEKTQHLGDLVSEYFEAAEDAAGLEQQMNATNEQMAEIQEEISSILAHCPELAPSSGEEEVAARTSPRALYQLAALDFQGPGGAVSPAVDREAIGAELAELAALQRALMERLVGDVLPPLLPFITGVWQEVDPVLLEGLLTAVAPALDAVELDLEALVTRSEALAAALRSGGPNRRGSIGPSPRLQPAHQHEGGPVGGVARRPRPAGPVATHPAQRLRRLGAGVLVRRGATHFVAAAEGQEFAVPITRPGVVEEKVSLQWSIPGEGGEVIDTFDLTCESCQEASD